MKRRTSPDEIDNPLCVAILLAFFIGIPALAGAVFLAEVIGLLGF